MCNCYIREALRTCSGLCFHFTCVCINYPACAICSNVVWICVLSICHFYMYAWQFKLPTLLHCRRNRCNMPAIPADMCCIIQPSYTCSDWCVGSVFEEECSDMWYALWFVRFRESIDRLTHNVLSGYIWTCVCVSGNCVCVSDSDIECVSVVNIACYNLIDTPSMTLRCFWSLTYDVYYAHEVRGVLGLLDCSTMCSTSEHEIRLAHPPNLSILISEGRYTTLNAFSHCEWTRIKSLLEWMACALNCCICMYCHFGLRRKLFAI